GRHLLQGRPCQLYIPKVTMAKRVADAEPGGQRGPYCRLDLLQQTRVLQMPPRVQAREPDTRRAGTPGGNAVRPTLLIPVYVGVKVSQVHPVAGLGREQAALVRQPGAGGGAIPLVARA